MGRITLFTSWASLLVAALFSAYYTGKLQDIDRDAVATVKLVRGKVFQRPENSSVYEIINESDPLYDGDYFSTGAGSKAEVQLLNSKTIMIGENSLIHISFGIDNAGLGSDIVTLLKGDVSSKAEVASTNKKVPKKLSFKVGKSSLKNIETSSGIEISKKLEQTQASIKVVSGSAQIVGDDNVVNEIAKNETIVVAVAKAQALQTIQNPVNQKEMPVELPMIKVAPQKIAMNDSKIMTAPLNLNAQTFSAKTLVEDTVGVIPSPQREVLLTAQPQKQKVVEKPFVNENAVKKPKKNEAIVPPARTWKPVALPPNPIKLASIPNTALEIEEPYTFVLFTSKPEVFAGNGIYFVKNQRLYGKVIGMPTQSDLVGLAKKHNVSFYFEGNAKAFLGGVDKKSLTKKNIVYAVDRNGIQRIDAALIRTRPAALELLRTGGYSIFDEKVNVLSVGH